MKTPLRYFIPLISLALCLFGTGCATPLNTPSGHPEVTIQSSERSVKGALINAMIDKGYMITHSDGNIVICEKPMDSVLAQALLGSEFNRTPDRRVTYNIIDTGDAVRIVGQFQIVTNPGSGFEQAQTITAGAGPNEMQALLAGIAAKLNTQH